MNYYAHTAPGGESAWQPLCDHLRNVATLARQFAEDARPGDSGLAQAAYAAGLLHDIGKYRSGFQERLLDSAKWGEAAICPAKRKGRPRGIAGKSQDILATNKLQWGRGAAPRILLDVRGAAGLDNVLSNRIILDVLVSGLYIYGKVQMVVIEYFVLRLVGAQLPV
ncbi:MAG: CRISPR-associated endonuclease Cas3'' [Phycisphaerae bacterium]